MDKTILNELLELKALVSKTIILNKELLNFKETVSYLEVSESHLYKLTSTGQIPHYKPNGKKLYFKRSELDTWILSSRVSCSIDREKAATDYILNNERRKL